MNKFKKKSKTKGLALGIAILSSAAVVSTGFAAWVISGGETKTADGTITADTVTNSFHTITNLKWDGAKDESPDGGKICFGHPSEMKAENEWLKNKNSDLVEKLTATLTFNINNVQEGESLDSILDTTSCKFEETGDSKKYQGDILTKKYVGALPSSFTIEAVNTNKPGIYFTAGSTSSNVMPVTMNIVFTWGTHFGAVNGTTTNVNPYDYYNGSKYDSSLASDANDALKAIYALNGATFTVTIGTR